MKIVIRKFIDIKWWRNDQKDLQMPVLPQAWRNWRRLDRNQRCRGGTDGLKLAENGYEKKDLLWKIFADWLIIGLVIAVLNLFLIKRVGAPLDGPAL